MGCRLYAAFFLLLIAFQSTWVKGTDDINLPPQCREVAGTSAEKLVFALNLLYFEAEFYLRSIGKGIDDVAPGLTRGPSSVGGRVANLDNLTRPVVEELGYAAVGNMRAILNDRRVGPTFVRPQLNISVEVFNGFIGAAFATNFSPPFNSYANITNYFGTSNVISEVLQQYLHYIVPRIVNSDLQRVANGIAGSVSARVGALRTLGYLRVNETVQPYQFTVGTLSSNLANVLNRLGNCGEKNQGFVISGAENPSGSNVVLGDVNSLSFSRTEREVLRIVFGTGNASMRGGVFPNGLNGEIAERIRRRGLA